MTRGTVERLTISDGYTHQIRTRTMRIDEAAAYLKGRRQRRFTSVEREGEMAVLTDNVVVCPCCQKHTPAYPRFVSGGPSGEHPVSRETLHRWQTEPSLFAEDETLRFSDVWDGKTFVCPHCRHFSFAQTTQTEVTVMLKRHKVIVSKPLHTDGLLGALHELAEDGQRPAFPLTRELVFDFRHGHAYARICSGARHMVTRGAEVHNVFFDLIKRSKQLTRKLRQAFVTLLGDPLPFTDEELRAKPELFLYLTSFHGGYDARFLSRLPLDEKGMIERSFRPAARRLRDAYRLPELYDASNLPQVKSVRRFYFSHWEYFWLLREAEALWSIFAGNVNLFLSILLRGFKGLRLLLFLHYYPQAVCFFRDYAVWMGTAALRRLLLSVDDRLFCYAVCYTSAAPYMQVRLQRTWKNGMKTAFFTSGHFLLPEVSLLLPDDMQIHGFTFQRLKTTSDFRLTGAALRNCLGESGPESMTAYVVQKNRYPIAALEIRNDQVVQALGALNSEIDRESELWLAIVNWTQQSGLELAVSGYAEDGLDF